MRNLLALFGLVVIGFGGVGWYMGWYKLNVAKNPEGNFQITTDVDTKKVTTDSSEFLKNVGAVIGSHVDKAGKDAKTSAPTSAPGATPGPGAAPELTSPDQPTMPSTARPEVTGPLAPAVRTGPIHLIPPKP